MSEKYIKPQTAKLVDLSKMRKDETEYRVREMIYDYLEHGYPISINSIAENSGLTRQAIYARPELRALIEWYGKYVQRSMFPDSEEEDFIAYKISNIQRLEEEVERLYNENKELQLKKLRLLNELFALENGIEL